MSLLDPIHFAPDTRPRGGLRQRLHAAELDRTVRTKPCQTVNKLLLEWAEGVSSAQRVWSICASLREDGFSHYALERLLSCAAYNKDPNTSARLQKFILETVGLGKYITNIDNGTISTALLPSTIFRLFYEQNRDQWTRSFGVNSERLVYFWTRLFASPRGQELRADHWYLKDKEPRDLATMIPCSLFEDAAPFSKRKSMGAIVWGSMVGIGTDLATRFVYGSEVAPKGFTTPDNQAAWDVLFSDFDAASLERIVDEWGLCLIFGKTDNEQRAKWGLKNYLNAECCADCLCNTSDMPYSDLTRSATWRPTRLMSNEMWLSRCDRRHPVSKSRYFSRHFCRNDIMHNFDLNGIAATITGGVVRILVHSEPRLGADPDSRLERINKLRVDWYRNHAVSSQVPQLFHSTLVSQGWAELSGVLIKAANTRHFCPFAQHLADLYFDGDTDFELSMRKCIQSLCGIYHVLYGGEMFLSPTELRDLEEHVFRLGKYHCALRAMCQDRHIVAFPIRPKAHYGQHLVDDCSLISSRFCQNYCEEGFLRTLGNIWKKSCSGPYSKSIQRTVMCKYLLRLCLDFKL